MRRQLPLSLRERVGVSEEKVTVTKSGAFGKHGELIRSRTCYTSFFGLPRGRNADSSPRCFAVRATTGEVLHPPADWSLLPPGDPAFTRRVQSRIVA